jgi:hypothetical protein
MGKHYVPQEYLRGFGDLADREQIWMFDKRSGEWSRAAIAKVAQQRDYFSPSVEELLNKEIEAPGHIALKRVRKKEPFTPNDRVALGNYIAVTVMRVPKKRRRGQELVPEVLKAVVQDAREEFAKLAAADPEKQARYLEQIEAAYQKFAATPPADVIEEIEKPWPSQEMVDAVHRMAWRFVIAPRSDDYLTSDNPAFYFDAYGVGSAESELTFPISPTLCLIGSFQGQPGTTHTVQGTRPIVMEVNRRMTVGAERFVFHHRRVAWLHTLLRHRDQTALRIILR